MLTRESEQQSSETYRRLIAAASEIFARHGYSGARVRQIAAAAQVNLAAVNYYFGGKEGLYRATLRFLAGRSQPVAPARRGAARSAEERLQRRIHAILERFVGERASPLGRILVHEAIDPTENIESLLEETMRPELERLHGLLKEIAGAGVPEHRLTHASLGILGQCLLYLYGLPAITRISPSMGNGRETCETLASQITEFSLGGIERLRRASGAEK
jgi:AcrR family transcriptional regulator